jgi:hypothetical protein
LIIVTETVVPVEGLERFAVGLGPSRRVKDWVAAALDVPLASFHVFCVKLTFHSPMAGAPVGMALVMV